MDNEKNTYGIVVNQIDKISNDLQEIIFSSASSIFNNTLVSIIVILTLCFYIYSKIGKEWNREDFYKSTSPKNKIKRKFQTQYKNHIFL